MNLLLNVVSRYFRLPQGRPFRNAYSRTSVGGTRQHTRLYLEALEDRTVPTASISVAGASLNEIGSPDSFITPGSGGLSTPKGITLGPDGNVYVAANGGAVLRYNGTTGAFINTFVSQGSGGLGFSNDVSLTFGPDGNLYVPSETTNQVLEYNGTTGAYIRAFVAAGSGGLNNPTGETFGPDGNLYVCSKTTASILRYQGPLDASPGTPLPASGQSGATFVATGSGGLFQPLSLIFGPDGNLYVDGGQTFSVLRFNGTTGAFIDNFIPFEDPAQGNLPGGRGMAFDQEGNFYVSGSGDSVLRYDAQGNFLDDLLVDSVNPELSKPVSMTFDTQGNLLISCTNGNAVVRYDRGVDVTLSTPSSTPVSVNYTTEDGTALAGTNYIAHSGTVTFAPGQTSREILLATQEDIQATGNVAFSVQLGKPSGGATIGTGTATVNVIVDDTARQFSVADTAAIEGDHTAHYRGAFVQGIPATQFNPVTFGPDGNLYTSPGGGPGGNAIEAYNGTTGAFIDTFVQPGQMSGAVDIVFQGGYLYVASTFNNEVLQYNATTGAFVSVFVTAGSGGLNGPGRMVFGPDGNLYVTSTTNAILRYNGSTGAFLSTFVAAGSGGLSGPCGLTFDPSGAYLYVASSGSNQVLKYNAQTGAYVGVAASAGVSSPRGVKFGPDGLLYVLSSGNNRILRYTENGTYVDDYVPAGSGGMLDPQYLAFGPNGDLYVSTTGNDQILQFGTENEAIFTVTNTTPSTLPLTVNYATADGTAHAGINYTATSGTLTFAPGVTTETICVPILDSGSQTAPLTFTLTLSSPEAATLSNSQAVGTILPSDTPATFYVVNGATSANGGTNTTYKYQASGSPEAPYGLSLNDLQPRGVATTAAGTTEWVVDANMNIYVYKSNGTLLGSWSATGLSSSAQLTGIATDGTNIWLVDSYSDKVFKYTNAASRLSGSQSAASSFALASSKGKSKGGDPNPQDIVTDGTSFWVVDGTALQVFKYTLTGSLLGSWTIDPADTHPTGITIDPTNVSNIWIVDNGTDKVYQYTAATTRTSGSQNAAATFALNPGDTNPQGIADPPPDALLTSSSAPVLPELSPVAALSGAVPIVSVAPSLAGFVVPFATSINAAAAVGPSAVAGVASLADQDAAFAEVARVSFTRSAGPSIDPTASEVFAARLDRPISAADGASPPTAVTGEQKPIDFSTPFTQETSRGFRSERNAVDLLDGAWIDGESQASVAAANSLFDELAQDVPA